MRLIKQVTETEMLLSWLKAEWYCNKFDGVRDFFGKKLVFLNDVYDEKVQVKIEILVYMHRHMILSELPGDMEWFLMTLSKKEFLQARVINEFSWLQDFGKKRTINVIAKKINRENKLKGHGRFPGGIEHRRKIKAIGLAKNIKKIKNKLDEYPILITDKFGGKMTFIEGNHRAVGFAVANERIINVIVGVSKGVKKCIWY